MLVETNSRDGIILNLDGLLEPSPISYFGTHRFTEKQIEPSSYSLPSQVAKVVHSVAERSLVKVVTALPEQSTKTILCRDLGADIGQTVLGPKSTTESDVLLPVIGRSVLAMGFTPCQVTYVTSDFYSIEQAQKLRLGTVYWVPEGTPDEIQLEALRKGPDLHVNTGGKLLDFWTGKCAGYYGECLASPPQLLGRFGGKRYYRGIFLPNLEIPEAPFIVAGRYFKTTDPRYAKHAMSTRLVNSKRYMDRQKAISGYPLRLPRSDVIRGRFS